MKKIQFFNCMCIKFLYAACFICFFISNNPSVAQTQTVSTTFSGTLDNTNIYKRPYRTGEEDPGYDWTKQLVPSDFSGPGTEDYNYFTQIITPQVSGNYSIEVTSANIPHPDAPDDTFIFLYSSFNPSSPLDGLIIANDDISDINFKSKINTVALTAGTSYVIVTTSYEHGATGPVTYDIVGPGSVSIGASNIPPVASAVSISGTLQVGQELTGTYTYTDADNDPQSGSTFKWYRSDNASGLNKIAIGSANATTYTLTAADADKYISFEVTPHDGTDAGTAVESSRQGPVTGSGTCDIITPTEENSSILATILGSSFTACDSGALSKIIVQAGYAGGPEFVDIKVYSGGSAPLTNLLGTLTNQAYVNNSINEFDFSSRNIRLDSGSVYTFVIERSSGLTSGRPHLRYINGNTYAGGELYLLNGGYDGFLPDLDLYFTLSIGPSVPNTPPAASVVTVAGPLQTGKTLTGAYTYYDAENDPEGASTYKWYRADNASGDGRAEIGGATDTVYVLTPDDEGKYIIFEVTPHDGTDAGTAVESPLQGPVLPALSAKARDYTVYLGPGGTATLTPDNLDNGSTGYAGLFLDRTAFSCDDLNATGSWAALGEDDLEDWEVHDAGIAASGNGKVYMAFQDRDPASDYNLRVLEWDGAAWNQVGAAFPFNSYRRALAVGPDGNPYVAYDEPNAGDGLKVARWDGVQWILLNNHVVPSIDVWSADLKFAPDGTLYIAFDDEYDIYYRKTKTKVMRWTGTVWEPLGANGIEVLNSGHQSLAFGNGDTVYVCFNDDTFPGGKVSVYRWDGTAWAPVGAPGISQGQSMDLSMVRDSEGTPYLAYYEGVLVGPDLIYRPVVSRWNGTAWESVGNQNGVFSTQVASISLAIGSDDALYLTYQDELQQDKTVVFKWNGANWMDLGDAGVEEAYNQKIAVADNGTVFVSQQLFGNSAPVVISRSEGIPVRLTAYNNYEDTVHAAATVRVLDTLPPVVNIQNLTVYLDTAGQAVLLPAQIDNSSSDNCGIDSVWLDVISFDCSNTGVHTVTLSARDSSGNINTGTAIVTVEDTIRPVALTQPVTVYLDGSGNGGITISDINNGSSDNCGIDSLWLDVTDFSCNDLGVNTVTLSVRDSSGNIGTGTAAVTVADTIRPVVVTQPVTVYLDGSGNGSITAGNINNGSTDNCGIDSLWLDITAFSCNNTGINTVTLFVRDSSGNTNTGTATVTVEDTVRPVVVTRSVSLYLDGTGTAALTAFQVNNGSNDACGIDSMWLDVTSFGCSDTGVHTVTLSVRDSSGNIRTGAATITVRDTIRPVAIARNLTLYLDNSGEATTTAAAADNGSYDNCGVSMSLSRTTFTCVHTGLNLETLMATDPSGNVSTAQVLVTVLDTIRPQVRTRNLELMLDNQGKATLVASQLDSGSTDNCTNLLHFAADRTSFTCADTGVNTVLLTVTDNKNNSATAPATVTVRDVTPPAVHTRNITVYLDGTGRVTVAPPTVNNGSTDNCGIEALYLDRDTFTCSERGQNTIRLYARDYSGNTAWSNAVITVMDTTRPVVQTRDTTIWLDGAGMASVTAAAVNNGSSDNCGVTSLTLDKTSFNCTNRGANTVILTATDASGNIRSGTATVTVLDTIRPVVRTKNITVALNASGSAAITTADINDGSTDNCGIQSMTLSRTSFGCADTGNNTVRLVVTDVAGNRDSATAIVRVVDQTAPTVVTRNISVYLNAGGNATITAADVDNGSSDNCTIISRVLDKTTFNCSNAGQNTVRLTVTDRSGNSSFSQALVTVLDTVRPVVTTRNLTIYLNTSGTASITTADVDNGSSDNCGITTRNIDKSNFNCVDTGINTVTLTVTDGSGNSRSGTATITVRDTTRPVVVTRNATIYLNAGGTATLTVADVNNGSSDNCGIQTMTLSKTAFDCSNKGVNTVTLTVTDVNGNVNTAQATVTVADQTPPVVNTRNLTVYLDGNGSATITPAQVNNNSSDNCGIQTLRLDINVFDCADLGANTVTLTVTDSTGNSAQKTAIVTVHDTIRPVIDNLPAAITAYVGAGQCSVPVQWATITASDNCAGTQVQTSHLNGGIFPVGTTTVTVTARDGSNNMRTGSFTVTVADTVSPVFSNIPSMFTIVPDSQSCGAAVSWAEPFAVDNCGTAVVTKTHTSGSTFPVGSTVVSYTATDAYNNSTTISFTVVVRDEIAPVINWRGGGRDLTVAADNGRCDAAVTFTVPVVADNCSGATLTGSHQSGDRFPVGVTTVTFTATDAAGNRTTRSFTVTVEDRQAPAVATVPADDTVGICDAAYMYMLPTGTDNCGPVTVTRIAGLPSGNIFPVGTTINTFELKDAAGNTTTVSFRVTVLPQGEGRLPSLTQICVYESPVDLTLGQQGIQWSGAGVTPPGTFDPAAAGTGRHVLSYTYTDGQGCSANGTIAITVLPAPVKPVVSRIGSTTLTTGNYITYQWYRDGHLIPGATTQQYTYTEGGNYQVVVANAEGCTALSDDHVIGKRGGGVGITDQTAQGDLLLYPNPSTGVVTIEVPEHWREELYIEGYGTTGQRILSRKVQHPDIERVQLDLSDLPRGMYYLHFTSGSHTTTRKVTLR